MIHSKITLFFLIALVYPLFILAKPLDLAARRMQGHMGLDADFTMYRRVKVLKRPFVSEGKLLFDRKRGLIWETKTPFANKILITENGKLSSKAPVQYRKKIAPVARLFYQLSKGIFQGDMSCLSKWFEVDQDSSGQIVRLKPKSGPWTKAFQAIKLQFQEQGDIQFILITGKNYSIEIKFLNLIYWDKESIERQQYYEAFLQ